MSDKEKYTAEHIRQYLEGKLTPAQMHALERAALHDPFLADALEGMELFIDKEKFSSDVEELNARLNERVKNRKGVLISINNLWWKIAAVLFIIITGVAVIIFTGEKNRIVTTEIAKSENKKKSAPVHDTIAFTEPAKDTQKEIAVPGKTAKDTQKEIAIQSITANDIQKQVTQSQKKSNATRISKDEETQLSKNPVPDVAPLKDSVVSVEGVANEKSENQANISRELAGKVAGVKVSDAEQNDTVYDEVVVVGLGIKNRGFMNKSKTLSANRTKKRVIPGNGWDEFERYIEDSTNITTSDSAYSGEEQLTFTIGEDGLPESIKILHSISPSHDKEAIRLLQNGPSWKVLRGKKRDITLKIIF